MAPHAPEPLVPLKGHCSVIYDNVLYVYSPAGFQALPLKEGAEWSELPMGISVTGARCVQAPSNDPAAAGLFIVGGTPNATVQDFPGLQRYSFKSKSWEVISPISSVTQNRQHHGAAFLNASQSIITYAGSQDGIDGLSSQTFLISTTPPFSVSAYNSAAPPLNNPIIMPWNESHAIMIGGSDDNLHVFTFGPDDGWTKLDTTLPAPLGHHSKVQAAIMTADDGTKVLEIFDMSVIPNTVTRLVLKYPDGSIAGPGAYIGAEAAPSRKRKRQLTVDTWPAYNGTLAPRTARTDYSLATDSNGLAVVVGGSDEDPLCIFNQRQNTWVNATAFLGVKEQVILTNQQLSSSSVSLSASATSIETAAPTASDAVEAGAPAASTKSKRLTVLGATLGAIFGIAAILIIMLLILRWRKGKKKGNATYVSEKDGRLSFADRGAEFMHEAGGTVGKTYAASLNNSTTTLGMMGDTGRNMGAMSAMNAIGQRRGHKAQASDASTARLIPKSSRSPLGFDEALEMGPLHEKNGPSPMMGGNLVKGKSSVDPLVSPVGSMRRNQTPSPLPGTNAFNDSLQASGGAVATALTAGSAVASQNTSSATSTPRGGDAPRFASNANSPAAARSAAVPPVGAMRSRSSGWSRYFTNNDATDLAQMQSNDANPDFSDDGRSSLASASQYTDSRVFASGNYGPNGRTKDGNYPYPMYDGTGYESTGSDSRYNSAHYSGISHPSQTVPPLELNLGESFERDVSQTSLALGTGLGGLGSSRRDDNTTPKPDRLPTTASGVTILPRGIDDDARSWTTASTRDRAIDRDEDGMYTGATRADAAWTPMSNAPAPYAIPQMPSFNTGPPDEPVRPRATSSFYGSSTGIISHYAPSAPGVPSQYGAGTSFGAGAPGYEPPTRRFLGAGAGENRASDASQITLFPRGVPSGMSTAQGWVSGGAVTEGKKEKQEDMSWVDLNGAGKAI